MEQFNQDWYVFDFHLKIYFTHPIYTFLIHTQEEGVESVLRSPVARRHTTSCASPLSPREPLVYPIPNTQQKSKNKGSIVNACMSEH